LERNPLTLLQIVDATLHKFSATEETVITGFGLNKAKTLHRIKKFNDADRHSLASARVTPSRHFGLIHGATTIEPLGPVQLHVAARRE
jgi:hypothetical protein